MDREKLILKVLNRKAKDNNNIDLDAYGAGASDMFDAIKALNLPDIKVSLPKSVMDSECARLKADFDTSTWKGIDYINTDAWFMYGWRRREEYVTGNKP